MPGAPSSDWDALLGDWTGPKPGRGFSVLSLYSGAGGLDLGFLDAGFSITRAIEMDAHAVETYRTNIGDHVVQGELPMALSKLPASSRRPDVIIGGPPCQGFSVKGRMDPDDPRSRHVHVFLDAVRAFQPAAFCMENVKALAKNPRWEPVFTGLVRRAQALGYEVGYAVLNAANYTVPQARDRMFLIGVKGGHPVFPVAPVPDGQRLTVLQALNRLPRYGAEGNTTKCTAQVVLAQKPVMRPDPYRGSLLFNGSGRPLQLDHVARTLPASMGGNATPIVDQRELDARLRALKAGTGSRASRRPWVVQHHARLQSGEEETDLPHPLRRITVEEASELQSFPLGWEWKGPRNARYHQIGNAVPPRLARYVALSLGEALLARSTSGDQMLARPAVRLPLRPRSLARSRRYRPAIAA